MLFFNSPFSSLWLKEQSLKGSPSHILTLVFILEYYRIINKIVQMIRFACYHLP